VLKGDIPNQPTSDQFHYQKVMPNYRRVPEVCRLTGVVTEGP